MTCKDLEPIIGCLSFADGTKKSIGIHYEYRENATGETVLYKTRYADEEGNALTLAAGDSVKVGQCAQNAPECVESQEWTYGIDNTGTTYADTATYEITLSNGQALTFEQTPTTGWTNQLTQWAANIQAVADDAGLTWFADPRAVNNVVPSDISGGYGAGLTPTGLPGAPSVPIAQGLIDGGMGARYVNIQICPAQPVPVKVERITSATYTNNPYSLNTAGAILGPTNRFFVCRNCGEEPVWYLDDGVTEASAGQIPSCYVPCGTLSLTEAPPESECQFFFADGCDNNNSSDNASFTSGVTRRSTICSDGNISLDYFVADPTDDSALISYDLMGSFVDCATGEEVQEPTADCEDFDIHTFWTREGLAAGLRNREWSTALPGLTIGSIDEAIDLVDNFDYSIAPTVDTVITANIAALNDGNNSGSVLDFQRREGFIVVDEPVYVRWTANSEGSIIVDLGLCGSEYQRVIAKSKPVGVEFTDSVYLPAGVHKIRLFNIDNDGTNSYWVAQSSQDDINFVNDNTVLDDIASTTAVFSKCKTVKICKPSGTAYDYITGEVVDTSLLMSCPIDCEAVPSEEAEPVDTCAEESTQAIQSDSGTDVPAGFHTVTINNLGGITTVDGGFELGTGRRVDTISFNSTNHSCINGVLPAITLTGGEWQWIGVK